MPALNEAMEVSCCFNNFYTYGLKIIFVCKKALKSLNPRDITEVKAYGKPPVLVETVLEAVMVVRQNEPSWAEAKRQLGILTSLY